HAAQRPSHHIFFHDTTSTVLYSLSLHDALPIWIEPMTSTVSKQSINRISLVLLGPSRPQLTETHPIRQELVRIGQNSIHGVSHRSEEHTSELQSRFDLVCRLLLEKQKEHSMCDR